MTTEPLNMWVVYENPKDYPNNFVARRWIVAGEAKPTDEHIIANDIYEIRKKLPPGLHRLPRGHDDDPCIRETWI